MAGDVTGLSTILKNLTKASIVVQRSTTAELHILANQIMKGSIERAPEKSGALVDSHSMHAGPDGFYVSVGPAYDDKGQDYSVRMHEGTYNLGPKSEAKNFGEPHKGIGVGSKFLMRSYEHFYRGALEQVRNRISNDLKRSFR